jgi:hypothetical protein
MGLTSGAAVGSGKRSRALGDRARYGLEIVAVAIAYTASGKLGLHFAFASHSVTAIWPPTVPSYCGALGAFGRAWSE